MNTNGKPVKAKLHCKLFDLTIPLPLNSNGENRSHMNTYLLSVKSYQPYYNNPAIWESEDYKKLINKKRHWWEYQNTAFYNTPKYVLPPRNIDQEDILALGKSGYVI